MSLELCAETLREHDPDRFGICLLAPVDARSKLLTLYALNLELARAPLASNEPLIAEMRLQWWIERLEDIGDGKPQSHELLTPLAEAWGSRAAAFASIAEARRRDSAREPHDGPAAVAAYVRSTAVPLALFAAEALDGPKAAMPAGAAGGFTPPDPRGVFAEQRNMAGGDAELVAVITAQAEGAGIVNWLAALPALQGMALGLWDPSPEVLAALASKARSRFSEARQQRQFVSRRLAPILFAGAAVRPILAAAPQGIEALAKIAPSEFRKRLALGAFALTHRWWI